MIGRTRWRFRSVTSTQDIAFQLASMGARSGTVVRADYQSAGRGRLGRTWEVPADTALTFSILLRPDVPLHQLGSLSIETAHALCTVLIAAGARNVALKWPNDVLVDGRKVSGILLQTRSMPDAVAVIGIGVNVNTPLESLPATATSLAAVLDHAIDPADMLDQIITVLDSMWTTWRPIISRNRIAELDQKLWLNGRQATLLDADREIAGTILGVAPDGALRMLVDDREISVHAGEITRGPRPTDVEMLP